MILALRDRAFLNLRCSAPAGNAQIANEVLFTAFASEDAKIGIVNDPSLYTHNGIRRQIGT